MKSTLIFCVSNEKAYFFSRLSKGLKSREIIFLTTNYSTYFFLKKNNHKVFLFQKFINNLIFKSDLDVEQTIYFDVKSNSLSKTSALKQYNFLLNGFTNFFKLNKVDEIILWNGSSLQGHIALSLSKKLKIKTYVFENANIEGKIFIDSDGVNAASSIANKNLIDFEGFDDEKLKFYLKNYKEKKELNHVVHQAKKPKIRFATIINLFFVLFSKYKIYERGFNFSNIKKYFLKFYKFRFDDYNFKNKSYIFFPLQVSTDSQIILNSDMSLIESLKLAIIKANEKKLDLVIKPHPAEVNIKILKQIIELKHKNDNIYLVNYNTFLLIKYSELIITINSTVGIEAMMYSKPILVFGKSFYKRYVSEKELDMEKSEIYDRFLYNYLFNILKSANYFNSNFKIDLNLDEI